MAKIVQNPVAVTSAVQVPFVATVFARGVEIEEDGSGSAAGLKVTWPNGHVAQYPPAQQPVTIGDVPPKPGSNVLVGVPANINRGGGAATPYCQIESMGADTKVRMTEHT